MLSPLTPYSCELLHLIVSYVNTKGSNKRTASILKDETFTDLDIEENHENAD